jgi:hypothetical protein
MFSREIHFFEGQYRSLYSTLQRNNNEIETNIPIKGIARPQSNFYIHVSVSDLHISKIGLGLSPRNSFFCEYINGFFAAV